MSWTCRFEFKLLGSLQVLVWKAMADVGAGLWLMTCPFLLLSSVPHQEKPDMLRCGHFSPDTFLNSIYTFPI